MELSHHELPSGWIAAGYTDDDGRFTHVATLRPGSTDEQIKIATMKVLGVVDTFAFTIKKLCRGLTTLLASVTANAPQEPRARELWYVRLPGATALVTARVLELTVETALLRLSNNASPVRFALDDLQFVEKAEE